MKYTKEYVVEKLKNDKTIGFTGFWGNEHDTEEENTFSNFYDSSFKAPILNNVEFTFDCSEQYFMYYKAIEFKDYETAEKILANGTNPAECKKLGREVENYDDTRWDKIRYNIMLDAIRYKFTQNDTLKKYLLDTNDTIIVETSPYDVIWGIGIGKLDDEGIKNNLWKNVSEWKGQNLLGFALMELRDELK